MGPAHQGDQTWEVKATSLPQGPLQASVGGKVTDVSGAHGEMTIS